MRYMYNIIVIISTILVIILLNSCHPDFFRMNKTDQYPLFAFKMNSIDSVEKIAENSIRIYDGGRAAIGSNALTQLQSDMTVKVEKGSGLRIVIRSAVNNFENHQYLAFDFSDKGSVISENGKVLVSTDSINATPQENYRVVIENDGAFVSIRVDCDEVFHGKTKIPASEYIILETLPGSQVRVSGINFANVLEDNKFFTNSITETLKPVSFGK